MKILKTISTFLIACGVLFFISFKLIGWSIDEQGMLHEPFALVPIGYLLIGSGCIGLIISSLCRR